MSGTALNKWSEARRPPRVRNFCWFVRGVMKRVRSFCIRHRYAGATFGKRVDVRTRFCLRRSGEGRIDIGDHCILDNDMTIECSGLLRVGARTIFGHHCTIAAIETIEIGEDCLIAEMVSIRDHNHRFDRLDLGKHRQRQTR